jgi:murein DD-endopeptidase MepM/ murein hydrolase activator NlpD
MGQTGEMLLPVDQGDYYNLWVPLGVYQFDANDARAGVVFLNDLTGENDRAIAFDAIRYRQIVGREPDSRFLSDGYDPPIGTASERSSNKVWPGYWFDATGFAVKYSPAHIGEAYHTGADLNLNQPYFDADAHSPVYAAASGVVTFAGRLSAWGNVIVIRHDPLVTTGEQMYGRYAHVENIRVRVGDRVQRGQQIANVGNAEGLFQFHLHFDLSPTDVLDKSPWDWPKVDLNRLRRDYVDPREFVANNRPIE